VHFDGTLQVSGMFSSAVNPDCRLDTPNTVKRPALEQFVICPTSILQLLLMVPKGSGVITHGLLGIPEIVLCIACLDGRQIKVSSLLGCCENLQTGAFEELLGLVQRLMQGEQSWWERA